MYKPDFELEVWMRIQLVDQLDVLRSLVEVLVKANRAWLRANPKTPSIYAAGVRYRKEPEHTDHWQDVRRTLDLGFGDCEDLCAWRVAELRNAGELEAVPAFRVWERPGATDYHVVVQRADGSIEDVSRKLGMP